MGIIIPPEPDPFGVDNLECFLAGHTPSVVYATFTGIRKGAAWTNALPEPANRQFTLTQTLAQPATYNYVANGWTVVWGSSFGFFPPFSSSLQIIFEGITTSSLFMEMYNTPCHVNFKNRITEPPDREFIGGFGNIWHLT